MASMSDKVFRQQPRPAEQSKPAEQPKAPPAAPADPLSAVAMSKAEAEAPTQPKIEPKPEEKSPPAPLVPPVVQPTHKVRVLEDGKLLIGACMHRFKAGNILDASHYDTRVFEQLLRVLKTKDVKA